MHAEEIKEKEFTLLSPETYLKGQVSFSHHTRIHGVIHGNVEGTPGSVLIVCHSGVIQGNITADTLIIEGYVEGNIVILKKLIISETGRVRGDITAPCLQIKLGSYFQGCCLMQSGEKI